MRFKVFVGFGGAGGKTLAQLAELAAQDHQLGVSADRSYFFILADTAEKELDHAVERIDKSLGSFCSEGKSLFVKRLALGSGGGMLSGLVLDSLRKGRGKQREVRDYWWHSDGEPFTGKHVKDITIGAGEMPLAAWFLAWRQLPSINQVVEELINAMFARARGESFVVELYSVSGLAGGTGRGCWSLLALRLRQLLKQNNITCFPTGFFFDATTFHWREQGAQPTLKVNSLTGLSEIAMWLRNDRLNEGKQRYQLPELNNPDVWALDSFLCMDDPNRPHAQFGAAPVDNAFIIFGKSNVGASTAEKGEFYYRMAATALYCAIRSPEFLSQFSNQVSPLLTIGSAFCGVQATDILDFMQRLARQLLCQSLVASDSAKVNEEVGRFSARFDPEQLLESVLTEVANNSRALRNFKKAIGATGDFQQPEQAEKHAVELEKEDRQAVEDALRECLRRTHQELRGNNPLEQTVGFENYLTDIIIANISERVQALPSNASELTLVEARQIIAKLSDYFNGAPVASTQPGSSGGAVESLFELTHARSRKSLIIFGDPFNKEEQAELVAAAQRTIRKKNRETAVAMIAETFRAAGGLLGECQELLQRVEAVCENLAATQKQSVEDVKQKRFMYKDEEGRYVNLKPAALYDMTTFIWRPLKPAYPDTLEQTTLDQVRGADPNTNYVNQRARDLCKKALQAVLQSLNEEAKVRGPLTLDCKDDLCETVRANIRDALQKVVGSSRVDLQACKLEYSIVSPK